MPLLREYLPLCPHLRWTPLSTVLPQDAFRKEAWAPRGPEAGLWDPVTSFCFVVLVFSKKHSPKCTSVGVLAREV